MTGASLKHLGLLFGRGGSTQTDWLYGSPDTDMPANTLTASHVNFTNNATAWRQQLCHYAELFLLRGTNELQTISNEGNPAHTGFSSLQQNINVVKMCFLKIKKLHKQAFSTEEKSVSCKAFLLLLFIKKGSNHRTITGESLHNVSFSYRATVDQLM